MDVKNNQFLAWAQKLTPSPPPPPHPNHSDKNPRPLFKKTEVR